MEMHVAFSQYFSWGYVLHSHSIFHGDMCCILTVFSMGICVEFSQYFSWGYVLHSHSIFRGDMCCILTVFFMGICVAFSQYFSWGYVLHSHSIFHGDACCILTVFSMGMCVAFSQFTHSFKTALKSHLCKQCHKWFQILFSFCVHPHHHIPSVWVCTCMRACVRTRNAILFLYYFRGFMTTFLLIL